MESLKISSIVIFLAIVACVANSSADQRKINDLHQQLFQENIEAAQWVADTTQDKQALEVMNFARQHGKFTILNESGLSIPDEKDKQDEESFGIFIAVPGDEDISKELASILRNKHVGASFNPDNNLIIVRGITEMSRPFRGIMVLQELARTYNLLQHPYDWKDLPTFCREAVKIHEFQNRITNILGGPKFVEFINQKVAAIKVPVDVNLEKKLVFIDDSKYVASEFFGKPLSDFEADYRKRSLLIKLNFNFLERNSKGDIAEKKAMSLAITYARAGLLPNP